MTGDIDAIIATLDERWGHTDCYRGADRRWHVKCGSQTIYASASGATLSEAFAAILARRVVRHVPRRPVVPPVSDYAAVRSGSRWRVEFRGAPYVNNLPTKREAEATIARLRGQLAKAERYWVLMWEQAADPATYGAEWKWEDARHEVFPEL